MRQFVSEAVTEFLKSCNNWDYSFPTAIDIPMLTKAEETLVEICSHQDDIVLNELTNFEFTKSIHAYFLSVLGFRVAVLATRTKDAQLFDVGILLALSGGREIDWRDALKGAAVLGRCANIGNFDLAQRLRQFRERIPTASFDDIFDSFNHVYDLDSMGIKQVSDGKELQFDGT